ncbi:MAG TPA: carbamoyltransferase C-terminal domain-containing protein [Nitrospira sp.]|nr:carbamoyltransferase C-terminal domain-containing protein [Nitrospira sp.]
MYILGLATMGESAAALLKDGILIAAAEEERFTRIKHEGCFPIRAIAFCLAKAGISLGEVEHIGVYWQPFRVGTRARGMLKTALRNPPAFLRQASSALREFTPAGGGDSSASQGSWLELFFVRTLLQKHFGRFRGRLHYLDHHRCHMASAFFASRFEEATILVFDGAGEEVSTTLGVGSGTKLTVLRSIPWPHSLGHFYSTMTGFLGFTMLDGEYKLMGLAPYGAPEHLSFIRSNMLMTDKPGSYRLNPALVDYHAALQGHFAPSLRQHFGEPRKNDGAPFTHRHQQIASSTQAAFEEVVLDLAAWAFQEGGHRRNLAIAGGCGLNCAANGRLLRDGPFERIYVPPAPHDAGCTVGAALLVYHEVLGHPRKFEMTHAYYGPMFEDAEIGRALLERGIETQPITDEATLLAKTVNVLTNGGVVGWFQGAMEFGPRALGARSFLADPRHESIRDTINAKIKKRELFRPFAPSIKEESATEYFQGSQPSPFMTVTLPVRPEQRDRIPAVTHVDGSARVQTVRHADNPRYWNLLDRFEQATGVPILLNTSFNIQEPIVCTPEQALATFLESGVDALVMGNYFIERKMVKPFRR